ncbi:uncharacterized protein [Ptychodera flava]
MFLGDARVGKTSLRRALMGETFQKSEASTVGIETRMCESREVDNAWHTCEDISSTDFECASSWYTAKTSTGEKKKKGKERSISNENNRSSQSTTTAKYLKDVFYIFKLCFSLHLLFIIPLCYIFSYGFAPFEWFLFLGMTIARLDFLTEAYRIGTGVALAFLIEYYIRCHVTLDIVYLFFSTIASNYISLNYFYCFLFFVSIGFIFGVLVGSGFRSGLAFGLCLLQPPKLYSLQDQTFELELTEVVSSYLQTAQIFLSSAIGLILVRSWTLLLGRLPFKPITDVTFVTLSVLTISVVLSLLLPDSTIPISFLSPMLLVFGKTTSEFVGREIDAKCNIGYFTYKGAGTLLGLLMGYFMGWTFQLPSIFSPTFSVFFMSILTHPLVEMYGFWKVNCQTLPIKKIRDAFKALRGGSKNLPTRLSLWDFAGDELYYSTHHVFLASHAVFLLVFNLKEAVQDRSKQLNRILFWLHSISIHAKDKDSVIFLVGTHRHSVTLSDQEDIDQYLFGNLYGIFCDRLVVNSDRRLVFMVENSVCKDTEMLKIKELISYKVMEAEYIIREFPIKYLHFYKLILSKRKEGENRRFSQSISSYADVEDYVSNACGITNEDDFRELLSFFHRAGEIIYQPDDPVLEQYVVFDPQLLVDIMKVLMNIPPRYKRSQKVAPYWLKLEQHGILHSSLVEHMMKPLNVPTHVIISLLAAYDLICPTFQKTTKTKDELFSVPCLMPYYSSMLQGDSGTAIEDWWISSEDEEIYYFDFGYWRPDAVFSRLLARCLNEDQLGGQLRMRQVFYDVAKFTVDSEILVKLEILHRIPEQNLIKVTVQRPRDADSRMCITKVINHVEAIRRRDFKHLEYKFGILCPVTNHRDPELQGKLHVVKLASQLDCRLQEAGPFNFLCEGQNQMVEVFRSSNHIATIHKTATAKMHRDGKIIDMPPTLHKQICNRLNVENVIAGDWRDLADQVGCSIEDVQVFSNSENPCGEVLYYWTTKYPVTIKELMDVLQDPPLSRADIISLIENHIVSP